MTITSPAGAQYLESAVAALSKIGILPPKEGGTAPILSMIQEISDLDQNKAITIARTLQHASHFNCVVRDNIDAMTYSDRYESISKAFDSIRDDAKKMVDDLSDGKFDWKEKLQHTWMHAVRGSIPNRFNKIRDAFESVTRDSKDQLSREVTIIEAYQDFRGALKESEIAALGILNAAEEQLELAKQALEVASNNVATATENREEISRLELDRDQALRSLQDCDRKYQVAKDLSENISISYNTGEVVVARLRQTTDVKQRVFKQAVIFFSTNETVFTALSAAFTSLAGLHESTQSLNAMVGGINQSLETLADIGDEVQMEGIKAGYGPNIGAESVRRLVDSVVNFQETQKHLIEEMRQQSKENAESIRMAVEEGKHRFSLLLTHAPV